MRLRENNGQKLVKLKKFLIDFQWEDLEPGSPLPPPRGDPWRPKSQKNRKFQIATKVHQNVGNVPKRSKKWVLSVSEVV